MPIVGRMNFSRHVQYVFFDVFEKVKKCIFALNFLKTSPMDLKIYAKKKLVIGPDFHQKFHQNRVISQKYTILQKVFIFYSTSR